MKSLHLDGVCTVDVADARELTTDVNSSSTGEMYHRHPLRVEPKVSAVTELVEPLQGRGHAIP